MAKSTGKGGSNAGSNVLERGALLEAKNLEGSYLCTTDQNEFRIKIDSDVDGFLTYTKSTTKAGSIPITVASIRQMISIGSFKKI
jgi:hypothetical protein